MILQEIKLFGENVKHLTLPHFNLGERVSELKLLTKLESFKIMKCDSTLELLKFLDDLPEDNKLRSFSILDTYPTYDKT